MHAYLGDNPLQQKLSNLGELCVDDSNERCIGWCEGGGR